MGELETQLLDCSAADTATTVGQYQLVSIGHAPKAHFHQSKKTVESTHLTTGGQGQPKNGRSPELRWELAENAKQHKLLLLKGTSPELTNEKLHTLFSSLFVSVGALGKII